MPMTISAEPAGSLIDYEQPVWHRTVAMVTRRRRALWTLTGTAVVLTLIAFAFSSWLRLLLLGTAAVVAALEVAYLALIAHLKARTDLATLDDCYWQELAPGLSSVGVSPDDAPPEPSPSANRPDVGRGRRPVARRRPTRRSLCARLHLL